MVESVDAKVVNETSEENSATVPSSEQHDKAKAELVASDGSEHESQEGKEEVFQDCLDEVAFAEQFDDAVAKGKDYTKTSDDEDEKVDEEEKEEEEPLVEQNVSNI